MLSPSASVEPEQEPVKVFMIIGLLGVKLSAVGVVGKVSATVIIVSFILKLLLVSFALIEKLITLPLPT